MAAVNEIDDSEKKKEEVTKAHGDTAKEQDNFTKPDNKEVVRYLEAQSWDYHDTELEAQECEEEEVGAFREESADHESELNLPLASLTMVDLYCAQGHYQRALKTLELLQKQNPNDARLLEKKKELQAHLEFEQEDEGYENKSLEELDQVFHDFVDLLNLRAKRIHLA